MKTEPEISQEASIGADETRSEEKNTSDGAVSEKSISYLVYA